MNRIRKGRPGGHHHRQQEDQRPDRRSAARRRRARVVSNLNLVKRATKPNPQAGQAGGIIEREASIHISNVMLLNPATGKGERVATKVLENGKRIRVFRSSGEAI